MCAIARRDTIFAFSRDNLRQVVVGHCTICSPSVADMSGKSSLARLCTSRIHEPELRMERSEHSDSNFRKYAGWRIEAFNCQVEQNVADRRPRFTQIKVLSLIEPSE